jgi:hypothetical protein
LNRGGAAPLSTHSGAQRTSGGQHARCHSFRFHGDS